MEEECLSCSQPLLCIGDTGGDVRQISWGLRFSYDSSRIIRMKISPQGIRRFSTCKCSINILRQLWMNHFSIYCFNSIYNMSQCICIQFSSVFKITLQNSNDFETTHWTLYIITISFAPENAAIISFHHEVSSIVWETTGWYKSSPRTARTISINTFQTTIMTNITMVLITFMKASLNANSMVRLQLSATYVI